jgi:hypothetical protein
MDSHTLLLPYAVTTACRDSPCAGRTTTALYCPPLYGKDTAVNDEWRIS